MLSMVLLVLLLCFEPAKASLLEPAKAALLLGLLTSLVESKGLGEQVLAVLPLRIHEGAGR